jgi:hypothetical protein
MGQYEQALTDLTRATDIGTLLEALWARASVYRVLGQEEEARADEWRADYGDPQGPCF